MFHQHFSSVLPVFYQCLTSVLPVFNHYFISVSLVFHKCFIYVSPVSYYCLPSVSPGSHHCFTSVSPVFHQCLTSVSPVFHQCLTSISPVFYLCCIKVITATRAYGGLVYVDIFIYLCLCMWMSGMSQMSSKYIIRQNYHGNRFYSTPKCLCNNWTVISCEFVWWLMKIKLPVTKIIHDLPLFIRLIKVITISF